MKKSTVRNYIFSSISFGVGIGVVFPFFSLLFVEQFKSSLHFTIFILSCIVAGLLVGLVSFLIGKITILRFLKTIAKQFELLAKGNLDSQITIESADILGVVVDNYHHVLGRFSVVLHSVSDTVAGINVLLHELSQTMNKYTEYTDSEMNTIQNLNKFMKILLNETNMIGTSTKSEFLIVTSLIGRIEELSETILSTSGTIERALVFVKDTRELRSNSETLFIKMERSMSAMSQRSHEVRGIIQIIQGISEQINLLSLNAAIESARAGDAGKGFAVVADEISKLADLTSESVSDIEHLIIENENEISSGEETFAKTSKVISSIISQTESISEIMEDIYLQMEKQVKQNFAVSNESSSVKKIANTIRDTITEHNLTVMHASQQLENIDQSIGEINDRAQNIGSNIVMLSEQSKSLTDLIKFFQLETDR